MHPTAPLPLPPDGAALREAFLLPPDRLYLDCAGHGPRLRSVQAAAEAALAASATRPWTRDWPGWLDAMERVRGLAARLFDDDAEGVALVPSAGYGLSLAAANLPLQAGGTVAVLAGQFPSNLLPWQQRCADTGARLHVIEREADGWTAAVLEAFERDPALRIAALPHAYWRDGERLDLDAISAAAHARGIALVLDLSQSLGALPADIARWRPAFAVSVGYKWLLGAHGLGYLWAAPHWRTHGRPLEHAWVNRRAREDWRFPLDRPGDFLPGARRFDTGGLDMLRLAMAEAGLAQVLAWGVEALSRQLGLRTAALKQALSERGGALAWPDMAAPHILGLRPPDAAFARCAQALADAGLDATARHGVLRIAPHVHVDTADMARVADVLAAACG